MTRDNTEACDNGNQTGCSTNCVPDLGYSCFGAVGYKSDCVIICGDGIKSKT
jgi:hypothetical protein